ncbi:MAG: MFS transporter [Bacteroidales bacterium]|nr:MFS transporter [Bacteroidales bacterium]
MTDAIKKSLRESKTARWIALAIVAFTMFTGYLFTEVLSPLKPLVEKDLGWDSSDFGTVTSAYGWFNVFLVMLILGGIILDKMGVRFSAIMSACIMVVGASMKYWAISSEFADVRILGLSQQVFYAGIGYAIFGVGVEIAGITVSKIIVKWFMGKELALAMGLEMATARLGSFVALFVSPFVAEAMDVSKPFLFGVILLVIGLIAFIVYNVMDVKLDKEIDADKLKTEEEEFKLKDIGFIISNRGFWYIAILCVLFYSAVFPFYKYGPDLMVNKFGISDRWAGFIPSLVPFGTILLTPLFGNLYDRKGKGASIMILGAVMLIFVHIILFLPGITNVIVAAIDVIVLGIAFSLVPSAMWPSVPKIIPEKQLGTAYALIFWIQNWGLMGIPFLLGYVLEKTNPGVAQAKQAGEEVVYNYTTTWMIFVVLTMIALVFAFLLKAEDKKKGYGLELPNIKR